jgi:hypothetical protein
MGCKSVLQSTSSLIWQPFANGFPGVCVRSAGVRYGKIANQRFIFAPWGMINIKTRSFHWGRGIEAGDRGVSCGSRVTVLFLVTEDALWSVPEVLAVLAFLWWG